MSFFRTNVFDPALVVAQILCMQSIFYTAETLLMYLMSFYDFRPTVDMIFNLQITRHMAVVQLCSAMVCAFAMPLIIERSKQCLDFAFTLHFIHLVVSIIYNIRLPVQLSWWLVQCIGVLICTVVSEYLCQKREMLDIPLTLPKVIST